MCDFSGNSLILLFISHAGVDEEESCVVSKKELEEVLGILTLSFGSVFDVEFLEHLIGGSITPSGGHEVGAGFFLEFRLVSLFGEEDGDAVVIIEGDQWNIHAGGEVAKALAHTESNDDQIALILNRVDSVDDFLFELLGVNVVAKFEVSNNCDGGVIVEEGLDLLA